MASKKPAAKTAAPKKTPKNPPPAKKSPVKASPKKAVSSKKAVPAKKAVPVKKAAKTASPVKKAAAKKPAPARKPAPAKKAPVKEAGKAKEAASLKKTEPSKKASPAQAAKPEPVRKAAVVEEAASPKESSRRANSERGSARADAPPPPKPGKATSRYNVGDKVVHPQHGAATIARRIKREFGGVVRDYYVLDISTESLTVMVPVEKVDSVVRSVISKTQSRNVLASLKEEAQEAGANWSRWYKVLTEKMYSGDIFQVAEVVRDLSFAQQTKGISPALKRMLSKARMTLISELSFSLEEDEEEATKRLDKALPKIETALSPIE
jgi:CarD family transcriptional regulator, regulator of rRNA transcription